MVRIIAFQAMDPGSIPGQRIRNYGVVVSTLDSKSDDPSSNLGSSIAGRGNAQLLPK